MVVDIGAASIRIVRKQCRKAQDTMADNEIIRIKDEDSGEFVDHEVCQSCNGMGGDDWSKDPEVYDDWHDCIDCEGRGYVELGHFDKDVFVPERDAWTPND